MQVEIMMALEEKFEITLDEEGEGPALLPQVPHSIPWAARVNGCCHRVPCLHTAAVHSSGPLLGSTPSRPSCTTTQVYLHVTY